MSDETLSFEEAMVQLETLVRRLESGDLPLDESLRLYQEGTRLTRHCYAKLDEAEKQVEQLIEREDGGADLEPLALDIEEEGA